MFVSKKTLTSLLLVLFFTVIAYRLCFAQTPTPTPMSPPPSSPRDILAHTWIWVVLAGSSVGWVVGKVKGFVSSKEWLHRYWPNAPLGIIFLLDVTIFIFVGSFLGTLIYNPASASEALAAGVSWPVGLGALATKD